MARVKTAALPAYRHPRCDRVLCQDAGEPLGQKNVEVYARNAARLANLASGGVHVLRHTFCSHLAMWGAPTRAIQELAGHRQIGTTQQYMHLSTRGIEGAIRLLEEPRVGGQRGGMVEAAGIET